jgi:hypothetical protein
MDVGQLVRNERRLFLTNERRLTEFILVRDKFALELESVETILVFIESSDASEITGD